MIVLLGHSGCFVPVMRFRVAVPTVPVFSVYRGSLPLAFCFVPVMRFCVAVPTVPVFSVYPRQFAFGFLFCPYHAVSCCRGLVERDRLTAEGDACDGFCIDDLVKADPFVSLV